MSKIFYFGAYLSLLFGTPSGIVLERHKGVLDHFEKKLNTNCEILGEGDSGSVLKCGETTIKAMKTNDEFNRAKAKKECDFAQKIQEIQDPENDDATNYFMKCLNDGTENRPYPYIEIEYIGGGDLEAFAEKANFQIEQMNEDYSKDVEKYFIQLCKAMALIEGKFIHRDLKPANIMLDGNNNIKIIDFDLMIQYKKEGYEDITTSGNMQYNSPEVKGQEIDMEDSFEKKNIIYSRKYDLFAVGAIFIYLMTRDQLFLTKSNLRGLALPIDVYARDNYEDLDVLKNWDSLTDETKPTKGEFFYKFWQAGSMKQKYKNYNKLVIPTYFQDTFAIIVKWRFTEFRDFKPYFRPYMLAIACQMINTSKDRISAKATLEILENIVKVKCHISSTEYSNCMDFGYTFKAIA